jgi:UDP-N-acetylmuramoyl-tripeptide--D-alanyl-D-alanine ligase
VAPITWSHYQSWLASQLCGSLPLQLPAPQAHEINTNSQTISPGQWFLPLRGEKFDGHTFIADAMAKGARGFFVQQNHWEGLAPELRSGAIPLKNTLKSLQIIAHSWRQSLKQLQVFALTGSVGKTTCKEFLAQLLSAIGPTHFSRGNYNNEVGVPLSLLQLTEKHRYSVIEMGARHRGDIAELVEIAAPNFVCCLNAHPVHLEVFGSLENIRATKLEIITGSSKPRACVFADQAELLAEARRLRQDLITFGSTESATIRIDKVEWLSPQGMKITLRYDADPLVLSLGVGHQSYPINLAAACALTYAAGIPVGKIAAAMASFRGIAGRFFIYPGKELTVVDDTYNANPESMVAGFTSLQLNFPQQRKIIVLGDMLELGNNAAEEHFRVGRLCQELLSPACVLTVGELGKEIGRGALTAGLVNTQYQHFATVGELIAAKLPLKKWGEVLYAKASRGMQLDKLITSLIDHR